jgi:hypothetical protein
MQNVQMTNDLISDKCVTSRDKAMTSGLGVFDQCANCDPVGGRGPFPPLT